MSLGIAQLLVRLIRKAHLLPEMCQIRSGEQTAIVRKTQMGRIIQALDLGEFSPEKQFANRCVVLDEAVTITQIKLQCRAEHDLDKHRV